MTDFDHAPDALHPERRAPAASRGDRPVTGPPGAAFILHLQRTAGNAAVVQALHDDEGEQHPITDVVSRGGSPIDAPVRSQMEAAFGHDFSDVRVHNDASASASAQSVGATAATVGDHIVFRSGAYDPSSSRGQHLLAHELTHVVQQRSGPVDGTPAAGGIRISDPSDRFESAAETNASHITSQLSAQRDGEADEGGAVQMVRDPSVQRAEEDEAEDEGS